LLAHATLAGDEDRRVHPGHALGQLAGPPHGRALFEASLLIALLRPEPQQALRRRAECLFIRARRPPEQSLHFQLGTRFTFPSPVMERPTKPDPPVTRTLLPSADTRRRSR